MTAHTLDEEGCHVPGEQFELRDELAREWIKNGWCLEVKVAKVERATAPKHETATAKTQRGSDRPVAPTPPPPPPEKPKEQ